MDEQPTPPSPPDKLITGHDPDGIQELDNDPPLWFHLLFFGTLTWSIFYFFHYHLGPGRLGIAQWQHDDTALQELKAATATGPLSEDQLRGLSANPERIAHGTSLYATVGCATCHGPEGTGAIGPNLRDRFWIGPNTMIGIHDAIAQGRANGQMPAHAGKLSDTEMVDLTIRIVDWNRHARSETGKPADRAREHDQPLDY